MAEERRKQPRTIEGVVVSDKMDKTVSVVAERLELHPTYKKYVRRRTKFHAHDEKNEARNGDTVRLAPTRPLSKLKRWRLVEVLKRAD
jgi:small subunit ribosomal protein S17